VRAFGRAQSGTSRITYYYITFYLSSNPSFRKLSVCRARSLQSLAVKPRPYNVSSSPSHTCTILPLPRLLAPRVRDVLTSVRPCAVGLLLVFMNDIVWMDSHGNNSSRQTILVSDVNRMSRSLRKMFVPFPSLSLFPIAVNLVELGKGPSCGGGVRASASGGGIKHLVPIALLHLLSDDTTRLASVRQNYSSLHRVPAPGLPSTTTVSLQGGIRQSLIHCMKPNFSLISMPCGCTVFRSVPIFKKKWIDPRN
jgi:hypothetical protein